MYKQLLENGAHFSGKKTKNVTDWDTGCCRRYFRDMGIVMWYSSNSPTYRLKCVMEVTTTHYMNYKSIVLNGISAWGGVAHFESLLRCSLHFVAVKVNTT